MVADASRFRLRKTAARPLSSSTPLAFFFCAVRLVICSRAHQRTDNRNICGIESIQTFCAVERVDCRRALRLPCWATEAVGLQPALSTIAIAIAASTLTTHVHNAGIYSSD